MVRLYWCEVHRRAFAEAAKALGLESRVRVVSGVIVVVVILACLAFWGSADASRDEAIVRLAIAGTVIGLFPFVYAYQLVAIPAHMADEARRLISVSTIADNRPLIEIAPCVSPAQEGLFPAKYIQVSVRAVGNLIGCQVMLNEVARMDGDTARVIYNHPQNAGWSGTNEKMIDINDDQEQRANLFSVSHTTSGQYILLPRTHHPDERLRLAVNIPDLYRLTIHASSKTSAPVKRFFMFHWGGTLDDVGLWEQQS